MIVIVFENLFYTIHDENETISVEADISSV